VSFLKNVRRKFRAARYFSTAEESALYAQVAEEVASNQIEPGLWAMAIAKGEGDEAKAKAKYLELRVDLLKQESALAEEMFRMGRASERAEAKARQDSEKARREEDEKQREIAALAQRERSVVGFLRDAGYDVTISEMGGGKTYKVTEPTGPLGSWKKFSALYMLESYARGEGYEGS